MPEKFIFLTFATEGPPFDGGANLVAVEQEFREIVKDYADKYLTFTPRKLESDGPSRTVMERL